jgi:anti-anti-sigma regulatory factor
MLKISVVDSQNERHLVLEGKLVAPWTTELRKACEQAREGLNGRELVIDLKNLTVISQEGQNLLAAVMNEGIKLRSGGVFAKQVLKQLVRRTRKDLQEAKR